MDVQKTFAEALAEILFEYAEEPREEIVAALKEALGNLETP